MVTELVEVGRRKCHQYWPEKKNQPVKFGRFEVTLLEEQSQAHFTMRKLKVKNEVCVQLQFHSWPNHGAPAKATALLQFVRRAAQVK